MADLQEVAKEYPDVKTDYNHVDACCMWMVKNPEFYDVIVTTNMFGDIITDLAAVLQGGLGVAAGGNINPDPGGLSMFEPMGGSAPKYTGKNVINPIAAIAAAGMLLEQCGFPPGRRAGDGGRAIGHRHEMKSQSAGKMATAPVKSAIWSASAVEVRPLEAKGCPEGLTTPLRLATIFSWFNPLAFFI